MLDKLVSRFAPALKPWVEFPFRYLAALAGVDFRAWVWQQVNAHWVWGIIAGALLVIGIFAAFAAQPVRTLVLIVLIGAGWFYGRGWGTEKLPKAVHSRQPNNGGSTAKHDNGI